MVLHIAIDGFESDNKNTVIQELLDYLRKHDKKYKVLYIELPLNNEVLTLLANYDLMNHEIALLLAFDFSYQYYNTDFEKYDIVIWERGVLTSHLYNADNHTSHTFIKQINKYSPNMDLTLIISDGNKENNEKCTSFIENNNKVYGASTLQEVLSLLDKHLPKCNWCGRYFKPTQTHRKYCTDYCSEESLKDQYRINNRNYYKRYKNVLTERQKGALGSKNANLHGTADTNPIAELEKVRNAKKALGLKPIQ